VTHEPRAPREDGPTELVEGAEGELVERLSGGTATLLLVWLIGVGALSTLLAAWTFVWAVTGQRLGVDALFGGFGFYTALAGAAGPCILWLAGRAQGHRLGWFAWTAAKIALVMVAIIAVLILGATVIMAGTLPGAGAVVAATVLAIGAVLLAQVWAVATWAADRWIARARLDEDPSPEG
jgi:cation transporter-like permease